MKNIKFTKILIRLACFWLGIGMFFSCVIQENFDYEKSGVTGSLGVSALEFFRTNDSFSMLREAIELTGLEDIYGGQDIRTFIAPTNQAFSNYLQSNGYSSLSQVPAPILRNVLRYHIVRARVIFTDPELFESNRPLPYETESGQTMFLSHNANFIGLINQSTSRQWEIATSNLEPTNGVIHVVNAIVFFSAQTVNLDALDPSVKTDTIFPIYDSFVNGGSFANTNYGTNPLLRVKNVTGAGDFDRRAYLMFDLNELNSEGVITDLRFQIGVVFTHARNDDLDVYNVNDTTWTEMGINWNNAPLPDAGPIATLKTTRIPAFNYDLTDFYESRESLGKITLMLDGEATKDETNDLASKEHPTFPPPMLIATIATGNSVLEFVTNTGFSVERGSSTALSRSMLEISGAGVNDIIYTVEEVPQRGWLVSGASILQAGNRFTQNDINVLNLSYINDGNGSSDKIVLSARDRAGARLDAFEVSITIQ
ncbi:DNRLRE domain-containing protein [Belliella kenyensis]|uniref:DNRLRE domain-containing protein n=1 Tax=Belliella kenyensis TaxID=1472724 RepID=A0ABV8EPW5_9BACT|nr:DNRLRE domain-containing protein [Belliella kenyensis]MCH7402004.1 DNRLRE domain-containing protein [Belliella kenyensis]MDN3605168.1 DNRLRE domain-containing protein [Belliella kenyensis]